jgi:hypothetical protein
VVYKVEVGNEKGVVGEDKERVEERRSEITTEE